MFVFSTEDKTMTTFQTVASEFAAAFETTTHVVLRDHGASDESTTVSLRDGSPDWMRDAMLDCHRRLGDRLPDDWVYEHASYAVARVVEHESADDARDAWSDIAGELLDVYTWDLLKWLSSHAGNLELCDEAQNEGKIADDATMLDRITAGQHYALESIVLALVDAIEAQADERDSRVHLLRARGGTECGADDQADGGSDADINHVTCAECVASHDSMIVRDSEQP